MLRYWLNGRTLLVAIALAIVAGSFIYSNHLSQKLAVSEREKVAIWVEAQRTLLNATSDDDIALAIKISAENEDIPIIETNEFDSITNNYKNIDSVKITRDKNYLSKKLKEFKKQRPPLTMIVSENPYIINKYYYGNSRLQTQLKYFPLVQLVVVGLFIVLLFLSLRQSYKSTQNRLWVGMAKETAHQLGTPISSLTGWLEILKENERSAAYASEMEKDIDRLRLISDRFGKIGSEPLLEKINIVPRVKATVAYVQRLAGENIVFNFSSAEKEIYVQASPPLLDWVIENLLKNALDAMDGKGTININIKEKETKVVVDVADTGKGISFQNQKKVFNPGFTTKKRGWGLGLALSKRIVEEYHKGSIYIKSSELGKGTMFRIELMK